MQTEPVDPGILSSYSPGKVLSASIQSLARHFSFTGEGAAVLDLADALRGDPEIQIVAVVGEGLSLKGAILRDELFAMLGRPCGRDVLKRSRAAEVMEPIVLMDSSEELFAATNALFAVEERRRPRFIALTSEGKAFRGFLAMRDLANHLSDLTREDVEFAGRLQERIIGAAFRKNGTGWEYESWSRPAKGLGGDFCLQRQLPAGKMFFALCDVSGKGASASVIVSMVWGMLRTYEFSRGLGRLVREINSALIESFHMEKYLTGVFMTFDPASRKLVVADMGHSHAVAFRSRKAYRMGAGSMNLPLGIEAEIDPHLRAYSLKGGDRIVFYSDGIVEQESASGKEFGEKGIIRALEGARSPDLSAELCAAFDAHRAGMPQQDDVSFMALSVAGSSPCGVDQSSGGSDRLDWID
jgi:sigma-B regulation protein RsbU (phosphoserine phosphatase)